MKALFPPPRAENFPANAPVDLMTFKSTDDDFLPTAG